MRALTLDFDARKVREQEVDEPSLEHDDQVLFRVREVGVCGTDRAMARFELGRPPEGSSYLVLGHEAAGQVVRVASRVEGFAEGDWVVPMVRRPCLPACELCARGRRDLCVSGRYTERGIFDAHGYFTELAVDRQRDLVRLPVALADVAVLLEPLSVVEKAVETALRLHEGEPRNALVLGAGAIGILAALALQLRGIGVEVVSLEEETHPRIRLLTRAGVGYARRVGGAFDLVIEAAGSGEAVLAALPYLSPLGVLVLVGAMGAAGRISFIQMIVRNQKIAGVVNAGPQAFQAAVEDLGRMPRAILESMIERLPFEQYPATLEGPLGDRPKRVHRISEFVT